MCTIRPATRADLDAMILMGRALHDESPRYRSMGFNPEKLRRLFDALQGTLLTSAGCVLVAEQDGELVGMTAASISERWFSDELFVSEITMYVRPEHRGGRTVVRLVHALEAWARQQQIHDLVLGVSTEVHPERTVRLYQRLGFQLAGYSMVKRYG